MSEQSEKQMSVNFHFLLDHIDEIHTSLCCHQKHWEYRTWQQRAVEALKEARRLKDENILQPENENTGDDLCDRCMRSGVTIDHTEDGQTVCVECAEEENKHEQNS